ncbi:MAG: T9SS type A sorting domain-containing protein [Prevotella sp.]|nr:T9SS type A sorting domain-containing protein [Prevotella sp.]MBP3511866.1 T9SS type A sorting domain-containing protein [Prevotella sp.]
MESGTIEQVDERNISITVNQSSVQVTGASGLTLEVVSLTGKRVMTVKIESPAQRVELNVPKGCYILKIGKVVRKVSIR